MVLYERSHEALADWEELVEYTLEEFGVDQTLKYTQELITCIEAMARGEGYFKEIDVKGRIIRVKHCGKHYIFGLVRENRPLIVIAFLHERMNLMARLKRRLG